MARLCALSLVSNHLLHGGRECLLLLLINYGIFSLTILSLIVHDKGTQNIINMNIYTKCFTYLVAGWYQKVLEIKFAFPIHIDTHTHAQSRHENVTVEPISQYINIKRKDKNKCGKIQPNYHSSSCLANIFHSGLERQLWVCNFCHHV